MLGRNGRFASSFDQRLHAACVSSAKHWRHKFMKLRNLTTREETFEITNYPGSLVSLFIKWQLIGGNVESTVAATSRTLVSTRNSVMNYLNTIASLNGATECDREVYWRARERSAAIGDLLTLIIDSFGRSKLYLPKFPFNRAPKGPAYQAYNRSLAANCLFFWNMFNLHDVRLQIFSFNLWFILVLPRSLAGADSCPCSWTRLLDVFVTRGRRWMWQQLAVGVCILVLKPVCQ